MQLRYNFRLYPTPGQRAALSRAFGCSRVVYNDALAMRRLAHEAGLAYPKSTDLMRIIITEAKRTDERAWLSDAPAGVLQQAIRDLDVAYRNFFDSMSGKRRGRRVGAPRFRSRKDNRQAVRYTKSDRFRVLDNGRLRLPKAGDVEVCWSRDLPSEPSSATVILDAAGRYHVSFVVQVEQDERLEPVDAEVGIDLGLTHFAVTSGGRKIAAPRFLRNAERRLKRLQQALARKTRGSNNRTKARVKVARAHARVADTRRDWQHKLSTTLIRENQAVYVEDLAVNGLGRTRLAKSVHDAGWTSFTSMLEYKAARYGRVFATVDRFFPSTRMCSVCGVLGDRKPLHVRSWICVCGAQHDRDVNAARNILNEGRMVAAGRAETQNACGAQTRPRRAVAPRREPGTHRRLAHASQ